MHHKVRVYFASDFKPGGFGYCIDLLAFNLAIWDEVNWKLFDKDFAAISD